MTFNVNILNMSTRAVTSIAYLVYPDTQKNMIATKIQIVSNKMPKYTTMSQNKTDSRTDCENAQLKYTRCLWKVYRLTGCPACHLMFEHSFHESSFQASILLSFLFIFSWMLNCLKRIANYRIFKDFWVWLPHCLCVNLFHKGVILWNIKERVF